MWNTTLEMKELSLDTLGLGAAGFSVLVELDSDKNDECCL